MASKGTEAICISLWCGKYLVLGTFVLTAEAEVHHHSIPFSFEPEAETDAIPALKNIQLIRLHKYYEL